jgi:hypothetical protein
MFSSSNSLQNSQEPLDIVTPTVSILGVKPTFNFKHRGYEFLSLQLVPNSPYMFLHHARRAKRRTVLLVNDYSRIKQILHCLLSQIASLLICVNHRLCQCSSKYKLSRISSIFKPHDFIISFRKTRELTNIHSLVQYNSRDL